MKKTELLTVKELAADPRISVKSISGAIAKGEISIQCFFAPSLLHLDTSGHIWIFLTHSLDLGSTV